MVRPKVVLSASIVVCTLFLWWLFGVSVHRIGGSTVVSQRILGRVTRIHWLDANFRERERFVYSWSEPFVNGDPSTDCAAIIPEIWQDRNDDGRWDTWKTRVGPDADGHCQVKYQVDTMLRGTPDWEFILNFSEYDQADAMIKERRGF